jgi:hypothetical protein
VCHFLLNIARPIAPSFKPALNGGGRVGINVPGEHRAGESGALDGAEPLRRASSRHNHLSGAVTAETLIRIAARERRCINPKTFVAVAAKDCRQGDRPTR